MPTIDINCDMGESYGRWVLGHDEAVMRYISSANVACGGHAGDPNVMEQTVLLAKEHGVAVGAHPGYQDLAGFGRRVLPMSVDELRRSITAQIGALYAIARSVGVELHHVKAHGALYNLACVSPPDAQAIALAVRSFSQDLPLYCPPGSQMEAAANEAGIDVVSEGFMDRLYEPSGLLVDRHVPGSVLNDPIEAAQQALLLANGTVSARDGSTIQLKAQTLCVHGDNPAILALLPAARAALEEAGYVISSQLS